MNNENIKTYEVYKTKEIREVVLSSLKINKLTGDYYHKRVVYVWKIKCLETGEKFEREAGDYQLWKKKKKALGHKIIVVKNI